MFGNYDQPEAQRLRTWSLLKREVFAVLSGNLTRYYKQRFDRYATVDPRVQAIPQSSIMAEKGVCFCYHITHLSSSSSLLFWSSCEGVLLKAGNIFADKAGRVSAASRCRRVCCRWCWTSVATQAQEWGAKRVASNGSRSCNLKQLSASTSEGRMHRPCRHHESERNDGEPKSKSAQQ